jgi:hypothetical protein
MRTSSLGDFGMKSWDDQGTELTWVRYWIKILV